MISPAAAGIVIEPIAVFYCLAVLHKLQPWPVYTSPKVNSICCSSRTPSIECASNVTFCGNT